MKEIYCFINGYLTGGLLEVVALAEDGYIIAWHGSSNKFFAKRDIGINSPLMHSVYEKHFPEGYELVWLDDPFNDPRYQAAAEKYEEVSNNGRTTSK